MSGFFSLSGKDDQEQDNHQPETNINYRGFELWQQQYQFHQQRLVHQSQQQQHNVPDAGFTVGPSSRSEELLGFRVMSQGGGGRSSTGNDDGLSCQDCGNQAKKDCVHMRCRTCCKSRGLPCQTHVRSTWIPAAKRRERQQYQLQQDNQTRSGENPKRLRDNISGAGGSGGGFELGHFPPELNSPAVFRCVRVSAIDDADEQFAYQTAVNIGGHVFKGILYDQGPESQFPGGGSGSGGSQQQPLDLIAGSGSGGATSSNLNTYNLLEDNNFAPNCYHQSKS
ncbi:hypothetical protein DH2020_035254 [Rehmannia glutinosa]|uniref:Uncharacterized protein n=1 Tax=Rehmannia glutinosa TaxID=99300 RepID=A0ABR0V7P6_REHGL